MSTNNTYLAVFLGSKTSPRRVAWDALPEADRRAKEREGMAAWKAWAEKHHAAIVSMGGPLGKTKKVTQRGIDDKNLARLGDAELHLAALDLAHHVEPVGSKTALPGERVGDSELFDDRGEIAAGGAAGGRIGVGHRLGGDECRAKCVDVGNVGPRRARAHCNADAHRAEILHGAGAAAFGSQCIEAGSRVHDEIGALAGSDSRVDLSRRREFEDHAMTGVALERSRRFRKRPFDRGGC